MAQKVTILASPATAKARHPLAPLALSFITLGIYGIYWWYTINREMVDLGRATGDSGLGDNPVLSVLAATIGSLIIVPPFVTLWTTCKRIERAQNKVLGTNNFSPVLAFVLSLLIITSFITPILMQSNLNQVWERQTPAP